MRQPLNIDRHVFAGLVLQGFNAAEVACKLKMNANTAHTWIKRMGLKDTMAKVRQELEQANKPELPVRIAADAANRTRELLNSSVERDLSFLKDAPATRNATEVEKRYTKIEPAVRVAAKAGGWTDEGARGPINNLTQINVNASPTEPAIDVSGE